MGGRGVACGQPRRENNPRKHLAPPAVAVETYKVSSACHSPRWCGLVERGRGVDEAGGRRRSPTFLAVDIRTVRTGSLLDERLAKPAVNDPAAGGSDAQYTSC